MKNTVRSQAIFKREENEGLLIKKPGKGLKGLI